MITSKGKSFLLFSDCWLWRFNWYKNLLGHLFFKDFDGHEDLSIKHSKK